MTCSNVIPTPTIPDDPVTTIGVAAACSGSDVIITNGGLTAQGGNVGSDQIARACTGVTGYYYLEVNFVSGVSADSDGIGISNAVATAANIANSWTNGFGVQTQNGNNVKWNGSDETNIGTWSTSTVIPVAFNLVDGRAYYVASIAALSAGTRPAWKNGLYGILGPSLPATNSGGTDISALFNNVAAYLTMLFRSSTADKFTINNGATAFTYIPPSGYAYGWGGTIPDEDDYATWDSGTMVSMTRGPNGYGAVGGSASNGVRSSSAITATTPKLYVEFMAHQLGNNNTWVGLAPSSQTLNAAPASQVLKCLGAFGTYGQLTNNAVGQLCVDMPNALGWIRGSPAHNWNLDAAADPATGVGGISLAAIGTTLYFAAGTPGADSEGVVFTSNPSYMQYTAPTGFTAGWPA